MQEEVVAIGQTLDKIANILIVQTDAIDSLQKTVYTTKISVGDQWEKENVRGRVEWIRALIKSASRETEHLNEVIRKLVKE